MKTTFTLTLLLGVFLLHAQVSVKSFGALGNGTANDAIAIQKALSSGNKIVYFEAGKSYRTGTPLEVPAGVTVVGNGATLAPTSTFTTTYSKPVIGTISRDNYLQTGISIAIKKGSTTFSYNKASLLRVGSLVLLQGPTYITFGGEYYKHGWYAQISNISGYTVTLNVAASSSFTATSIQQFVTYSNITIKDLKINLKGRKRGFGVSLANAVNSYVTGCNIESDPTTTAAEVGILATGYGLNISNNIVRNFRISTSGQGYGINVEGHNITVRNNDVSVARHCITSAGRYFMSTKIYIVKNKVDCGPGGAPIDFHGNANGKIDSNTVYSTTPNIVAIMIRNGGTTISNNSITMTNASGTNIYGVAISENGFSDVTVTKNKFYFKGTSGGVRSVGDFGVAGTVNNYVITKNYFQGCVDLSETMGTGIRIDSNTFEGNNVYNVYVNMNAAIVKEYSITGNTFINNYDGRFNYSITTTTYMSSQGTIKNNIIRCTNPANLSTQIRLNNQKNIVENNTIYSQDDWLISDYTPDLQNWLSNNKLVNNASQTSVIKYVKLPKATAWFVGRSIMLYDKNTKTTFTYKCVQISSSSYAWQKQSSSTTT